jgi:hypothetical protein
VAAVVVQIPLQVTLLVVAVLVDYLLLHLRH